MMCVVKVAAVTLAAVVAMGCMTPPAWTVHVTETDVQLSYGPMGQRSLFVLGCTLPERKLTVVTPLGAGALKEGERSDILLETAQATVSLPATARTVFGIRFVGAEIPAADDLLALIGGPGTLAIGVKGRRETARLGSQAAQAVETFRKSCPAASS